MSIERRLQHAARDLRALEIEPPPLATVRERLDPQPAPHRVLALAGSSFVVVAVLTLAILSIRSVGDDGTDANLAVRTPDAPTGELVVEPETRDATQVRPRSVVVDDAAAIRALERRRMAERPVTGDPGSGDATALSADAEIAMIRAAATAGAGGAALPPSPPARAF